MSTRAFFWVGDPRDKEKRQFLGYKHCDAYPGGLPELGEVETEADFVSVVEEYKEWGDFTTEGFTPKMLEANDIMKPDYTYAFFNGTVQVAHYDSGFVPFKQINESSFADERSMEEWFEKIRKDVLELKKLKGDDPDQVASDFAKAMFGRSHKPGKKEQ